MPANRLLYQQFSFDVSRGRVAVMNDQGQPAMQETVILNVTPVEMTANGPVPIGPLLELWFTPESWDVVVQQGNGSKLTIARDIPPGPNLN